MLRIGKVPNKEKNNVYKKWHLLTLAKMSGFYSLQGKS